MGAGTEDDLTGSVIEDFFRKHNINPAGKKIGVALSGGPDSTALLLGLKSISSKRNIDLCAIHYDHRLRESSSSDARFCEKLADRLAINLHIGTNEAGQIKGNVQEKARDLRYAYFEKVIAEEKLDYLATAHTAGDSIETSLIWLMRGTGSTAFEGISPIRGHYIRPFIETDKKVLLDYLESLNQPYATDPTNISCKYLRNRVRNELLPLMEELTPGAVRNIARFAKTVSDDGHLLDEIAGTELEKIILENSPDSMTISSPALLDIDRRIRYRIYRIVLDRLGMKKPKSKERILSIDRLLTCGRKGKEVELGNGALASLLHGGLKFSIHKRNGGIEPLPLKIPMRIKTCAGSLSIMPSRTNENTTADMTDIQRLGAGLVIRNRKAGDYILLKKSGHKKSLKKFLIDKKTDADIRNFMPMIADGAQILYIPGLYIADRIEADKESQDLASIEWTSYRGESD